MGGKKGGEGYWRWSDKKGGGWALDSGRFAVLIKPSDDFTFFFLFSNMSFSPLSVLSIPIPQQNQIKIEIHESGAFDRVECTQNSACWSSRK